MKIVNTLRALISGHLKGHFGQYAEDVLIRKHFKPRRDKGVCLDIGSYHPFRFNNTAYLWMCGWKCVNVDANPNSIELFKKYRSSDINIHAAVISDADLQAGKTSIDLHFPVRNQRSISAIGTVLKEKIDEETIAVKVPTQSIRTILETNNLENLSYINIDIEGLDEAVLFDIDFRKHTPKVITIEQFAKDINEIVDGDVARYLRASGYVMHSRAAYTSVYVLDQHC